MKHVVKASAPQAFEDWKALRNEVWTPSYADLRNPEKQALHDALLMEQHWVCCYCGRSIDRTDSHIEHFRPQEHFPDRALDYDNLHTSCIRDSRPGMPLHCGHAKSSDWDQGRYIDPQDPSCESRFRYTFQGQVMVADADPQAEYMRDLLKLDIPFLRSRREEAIRQVFDPGFLATVTDDELARLRDEFRAWDAQGHGESFGHVVARFAEQLLG